MHDAIFAVSPAIRYVAIGRGQGVQLQERPGLADGAFFRLVLRLDGGHVSVAIERAESPTALVEPIREALASG